MRSGSDYRPSPSVLDPMTTDGCGIKFPPILAFKNLRAIIKIRTDAVCCIHVNTIKSISQLMLVICSHQIPDFSAKMSQIQFLLGLRWGSLQRSLSPLIAGGEGAGHVPLLKNPTLALGPSGLYTRQFGPHCLSLPPKSKSETPPMACFN